MSFALLVGQNRRTIRAPVNPMDKCTVVSIFPKNIDEVKHTISPGRFIISPGIYEQPSLLTVGPSSWWRDIDENQPLLEIPNSSLQVAESIVKDYCNGILACDMGESMPGLFWLPGSINLIKLKTEHKEALDNAARKQKNWYETLVRMANALWARSNGNPLTISDDMRLAAKELGRDNLDWMQDSKAMDMIRCIACGALRNPNYPVCGSCHAVIDKKKAQELGLEFAK